MFSSQLIWMMIATLAAFFIKGLCGFANTLIFQSILSFTTDNINISPVELLLSYPSNMLLAWTERKHLKTRIWLPISIMILAGSIPGVFLLKNLDGRYVKIVCGIVIVLAGIDMMLRKDTTPKQPSRVSFVINGILAGLLCGIYGIGIILATYLNKITSNTHEFKGNMGMVFVIENTFRVILYIATGIITLEVAKEALILLPISIFAVLLGIKSATFLDEKVARKIVIVLLIISGAAMVFMAL